MNTSVQRISKKVWSNKTETAHFIPFHTGSALEITNLKVDFNLQEATTKLRVRRGVRYS
ncbi:MAG: hypothetical protein JRI25_08640, partial [Deltaproteobacteria bacterium]|nr:hypothetical protein [Deltaproteobacteria bacterium]